MLYELKTIKENDFDHPCGFKWGSKPKGEMKELPYSDLRRHLSEYSPRYISYNQIQRQDAIDLCGKGFLSAITYYFHDYCLVVPDSGDVIYQIAPCLHEYKHSRNLGNCYNEYKCEKCGALMNIDSSG